MRKLKTYKVDFTGKSGKKLTRNVRAISGDNAWLYAKNTLGGKGIKVKLKKYGCKK